MIVTIDHAASSYGVPVILGDDGQLLDYAPGIRSIRDKLGLTARQLGELCGVSERTVNGWEQGRMPETAALNMLGKLLSCVAE